MNVNRLHYYSKYSLFLPGGCLGSLYIQCWLGHVTCLTNETLGNKRKWHIPLLNRFQINNVILPRLISLLDRRCISSLSLRTEVHNGYAPWGPKKKILITVNHWNLRIVCYHNIPTLNWHIVCRKEGLWLAWFWSHLLLKSLQWYSCTS